MFTRIAPWIVFNGAPTGGGGETPLAQDGQNQQQESDLGFPASTPVAEMTDKQQAAYWRNESKKHQRDATEWSKLGDRQTVSNAIADAETARQAALTEGQRAVEAARNEGRSEGTKAHLGSAIEGRLIALTKGAGESFEDAETRVKGALSFADVTLFVASDGSLDAAKVQTFAASLAPGASSGQQHQQSSDPLHEVLGGASAGQQASAGSVDAYEAKVFARLNPTK